MSATSLLLGLWIAGGNVHFDTTGGSIGEDGVVGLTPGLYLGDPKWGVVWLMFKAPLQLRVFDQAPDDPAFRRRDWDEASDYVGILRHLRWRDEWALHGVRTIEVDVVGGQLHRRSVGHGSIVDALRNDTGVDTRRGGLHARTRLDGWVSSSSSAFVEVEAFAADLAGDGPLGGRVAFGIAGAHLGATVIADPLALGSMTPAPGDVGVAQLSERRRIEGPTTTATIGGAEVGYTFGDRRSHWVTPYVDVNGRVGGGAGLHAGVEGEWFASDSVTLGFGAEYTHSSPNYEPGYFDTFYYAQRDQAEFVARNERLSPGALTKAEWVEAQDLRGAGGAARFDVSFHDFFVSASARLRPGPLGVRTGLRAGWSGGRGGVALHVEHRGAHGFEWLDPAGTLATADARFGITKHVGLWTTVSLLHAARPLDGTTSPVPAGTVAPVGRALVGVTARFPW